MASASDPVSGTRAKALDASDPKILESVIGENEIHLYKSDEQHGNWLECIQTKENHISPAEIGRKACTICLITHIAMKLNRKLNWNPGIRRFENDIEANAIIQPSRDVFPYGISNIKRK